MVLSTLLIVLLRCGSAGATRSGEQRATAQIKELKPQDEEDY